MSDPRIHAAAARGFEAGVEPYERARPGYPEDAVALLAREVGMGPGRDVLELGAGTGKLTELILGTGARITATEPVPAMRAALTANCPDAVVLDGTAESIPLGDGSVDAVVAAQAFHWFDGERALDEIHRVLRPNGRLGLVWNARVDSSAWARRITEIFDRLAGDGPRYRDMRWREPFERTALFDPLRHRATGHVHEVSREGFLDRVLSVSYVASATRAERDRVVAEVHELLETDPELAGRDRIPIPYDTDVYWTARR